MSFRPRNLATVTLASVIALAWSGCTAKKQTEYVPGISTQVQVPRDMKTVRVDLYKGGVQVFCQAYPVFNGRVQLPNSLGSYRAQDNDDGVPLTVSVAGYTDDFQSNSANPAFITCPNTQLKVGENSARILRSSRQPYQTDKVLFLPMPLKYACLDVDCDKNGESGLTCKGGSCKPPDVDPAKLITYRPELVDGTGGNCFHVSDCMAAAFEAATVDDAKCIYAVQGTPSAPPLQAGAPKIPSSGDGVNVQLIFDGGVGTDLLDLDPDEGFTIPDPSKPQQFQLAPGLCALVHGYDAQNNPPASPHRITAIRASGLCRAKTINEPICYGDQLNAMTVNADGTSSSGLKGTCDRIPLDPAKSVIMVLADDTQNHNLFYAAAAQGIGTDKISFTLGNPAFTKTQVGLSFFPGPGTCAADHPRAQEPGFARDVYSQIHDKIVAHASELKPANTPVDLDGALRDAYNLLGLPGFADYNRRAVIVIGNRGLNDKTCTGGTASELAQAAESGPNPIETYALLLVNNVTDPAGNPAGVTPDPNEGGPLSIAGGTGTGDAHGPYNIPADSNQAENAIKRLLNDLTTCVLEGAGVEATAKLSYTAPDTGHSHSIDAAAAGTCTKVGDPGNGWGFDSKGRIILCGQACSDYQTALFNVTFLAASTNPPQEPIPVPVFAYQSKDDPTAQCAPKDNVLPPGVPGQ